MSAGNVARFVRIAIEAGDPAHEVKARIAELRGRREEVAEVLDTEPEVTSLTDRRDMLKMLAAVPDLSEVLRIAPIELKRQVFEAFGLEIRFDKLESRIEISATITEAVANAFGNEKTSQGRPSTYLHQK